MNGWMDGWMDGAGSVCLVLFVVRLSREEERNRNRDRHEYWGNECNYGIGVCIGVGHGKRVRHWASSVGIEPLAMGMVTNRRPNWPRPANANATKQADETKHLLKQRCLLA